MSFRVGLAAGGGGGGVEVVDLWGGGGGGGAVTGSVATGVDAVAVFPGRPPEAEAGPGLPVTTPEGAAVVEAIALVLSIVSEEAAPLSLTVGATVGEAVGPVTEASAVALASAVGVGPPTWCWAAFGPFQIKRPK